MYWDINIAIIIIPFNIEATILCAFEFTAETDEHEWNGTHKYGDWFLHSREYEATRFAADFEEQKFELVAEVRDKLLQECVLRSETSRWSDDGSVSAQCDFCILQWNEEQN